MTDIDTTDLLERIIGCINNAEYDDEADTLMDALVVIEAQAAEIERLREALLSCPLIARYETAEKFRERQDDWLANTYRAAIAGKAEQ
jgi:hypothetical protein